MAGAVCADEQDSVCFVTRNSNSVGSLPGTRSGRGRQWQYYVDVV